MGCPGDRPIWRGVSKGEEDGRRPPTLWAGYSRNGHNAVLGVARLQGVEGLGMAGPGETLGSPWIPLVGDNGSAKSSEIYLGLSRPSSYFRPCNRPIPGWPN
jgi:hypothetical protein